MTTRRAMANPAGKRVGVEVGTPVSGSTCSAVPIPVPVVLVCSVVSLGASVTGTAPVLASAPAVAAIRVVRRCCCPLHAIPSATKSLVRGAELLPDVRQVHRTAEHHEGCVDLRRRRADITGCFPGSRSKPPARIANCHRPRLLLISQGPRTMPPVQPALDQGT